MCVSVVFAAEKLTVVENEKVCMVTDQLFPKKQIPITVEGKTYYGCCENCKASLGKDPKVRKAVDPISKKPVDKATAVIAAREDGSVIYFENKNTFEQFTKKQATP
jgi:YHS domain-containing protein